MAIASVAKNCFPTFLRILNSSKVKGSEVCSIASTFVRAWNGRVSADEFELKSHQTATEEGDSPGFLLFHRRFDQLDVDLCGCLETMTAA